MKALDQSEKYRNSPVVSAPGSAAPSHTKMSEIRKENSNFAAIFRT